MPKDIVNLVCLCVADTAGGELDGGDDGAVGGGGEGDGQEILVSESLDTQRPLSPGLRVMGGARGQTRTRGARTEARVHRHVLVNTSGLDNDHISTWGEIALVAETLPWRGYLWCPGHTRAGGRPGLTRTPDSWSRRTLSSSRACPGPSGC